MPTKGTWEMWLARFYDLRRDKRGSHERPHKPVLLLAILDLLDRGVLTQNEVPLDKNLTDTFKRYFAIVRERDDQPAIENPFYHLCGDGFWHLIPKPGEPPLYQPGKTGGTPTLRVLRSVRGQFDDSLWNAILSNAHARTQLRDALIARYFPEHYDEIAAMAGAAALRAAPNTSPNPDEPPGRDSAFRHTVLEIYDYRCSACGVRIRISDELSLVQAAHLIPFVISRNDKPSNGVALCPNHHWAMDRHLIAPCPDSKRRAGIWRVASTLDSRIDGQKDLVALHNQPVLPPVEEKFYPALESLRWRERNFTASFQL